MPGVVAVQANRSFALVGQKYSVQRNGAYFRQSVILHRTRDLIFGFSEELQKTPEKVEALIQGKFYYTAVRHIVAAQKLLESAEFVDIGALDNIKSKLKEINAVRLMLRINFVTS